MKEIKFMAYVEDITTLSNWDSNITEKMFDVKSIDFVEKTITILNPNEVKSNFIISLEEVKLLQFTGLKDKNGKEIHERDVIKSFNRMEKKEILFVVEFCDGIFECQNGDELVNLRDLCYWDNCERIGNIYENPELIKEVKKCRK